MKNLKKNKDKIHLILLSLTTALLLLLAMPVYATGTTADLETEISDAATELQVKTALLQKIGWDMLTVDVEAENGHVYLNGVTEERSNQELAKEVALSVEGVKEVTNRLALEKSKSEAPVGEAVKQAELEVKDAVLESRVKTELITEMGADAFQIEVEATDGRVSLRGDLDNDEHRQLALKTVEQCAGVEKVVDLLSVSS